MSRLPPNPTLKQLEALIGEWEVEVPQFSGQRGRATFEWIEGGAFLRFQADAPSPAPSATWVIGRDDSSETYTTLYYDSRAVSRVSNDLQRGCLEAVERGAWLLSALLGDAQPRWQLDKGRMGEVAGRIELGA
jgi:hypothetical protein